LNLKTIYIKVNKVNLNPELIVGDKVLVIQMENETISPFTEGVVTSVNNDPFETIGKLYGVKWSDGSTLSLVSVSDFWIKKEDDPRNLNEDSTENAKWYSENIDVFKYFNISFFIEYLLKLRESGIVNMHQAGPYLYMGREKIAHEFYYNPPANEDEFEEILDMADVSQSEMINSSLSILEEKNLDYDESNINRLLKIYSNKIINVYIKLHS
jgi:hypothetical protein